MLWLTPVIPAIQEAQMGRMTVQGQPRQKAKETPSQPTSWMWWYVPIIPVMWEAVGTRMVV
jgi:hypothetical protein